MSGVRRGLLLRVDHVWDLGWWNLVGVAMVGFFAWLASFPLYAAVDGLRAERAGITGSVRVSGCDRHDFLHRHPWRCHRPTRRRRR